VLIKLLAAGAALVAALFGLVPPSSAPTDAQRDLARARDAYAALQKYFATGGVYSDAYPPTGPSSAWSWSQTVAGTIALAQVEPGYRTDLRQQLTSLDLYWSTDAFTPYPGTGSKYYDDNEWLGQDLVRAARMLGDPPALDRARQLFAFVTTGWDSASGDACPGGVFWTQDPRDSDRNTVSTANGAVLAIALYQTTGDPSYLRWGRTMTAWVDACLRGADGLYWDHLSQSGQVDRTVWSYNQGAMIAANVGLYEATGDVSYVVRAAAIAQAALARYSRTDFAGERTFFVAIFFRDLKVLDAVAPDASYATAAQRYADACWENVRDSQTGLYPDTSGRTTLLDQAAMVDLFAQLAD
jgi:hypothetical protein